MVFSNTDQLFSTRQECLVYTAQARNSFLSSGKYARGGCIVIPKLKEKGIGI
jgi:hypothetical protein|tara:strand:+ start:384 stop:539 length:156 start_codon:yes stop_codon:yes gene_type:complete